MNRLAPLFLCLAFLAGCPSGPTQSGGSDAGPAKDGGSDAGPGKDGGNDAGPGKDGGGDAGSDAGCTPVCAGIACGAADGCGGTCLPGSGCTTQDAGCTPACSGKTCGSANGCGGTCQSGSGCCTPFCTGVACGLADGCGGTCQPGSGCTSPDGGCTPACSGKLCGSADGCGGTCAAGSGCCTPFCTGVVCGSANGCGGTCTAGSGCCTPACSGVACGTADGCGGTCQPGSGCTQSQDAGCTPSCAGKSCGASDGCTGTCQPGSGCCTPSCSGVVCGTANGCGGTCQPGSGCCTPTCSGVICGSADGCGGTCTAGSGCCTPACAGKLCGTANGCGGTCTAGSGCCTPTCSGVICGSADGCGGTCTAGSGCCTPACAGKLCGAADGCGGTCQAGSGCCVPICTGKVCGAADGCGGTCTAGSGCCTPVCTGKTCGTSDGCGGTCTAGSGCCTPTCSGIPCGNADGCGGTCQPGSGCTAPACSPPTYPGGWGAGSGDIGASCTANSCAAGEHCYSPGTASSMCYQDCTFDSSVCPGSSVCVGVGGGESWCLKSCDWSGASSTCRTGFGCNPFSSNNKDPGVCFPACANAAACNGTSGLYNYKCGSSGATKGACLCTRDSDCNGGSTGSWKCDTATGGCIMPCTSDGTCATSGAGGCCLTQAGLTTQCELFTSPTADCTTLGCATGWQCQNTGTKNECVATQPLSCAVTTRTVNKTSKETVAYTGSVYLNQKAEISFTVPAGASGWTIIAQGPGTRLGLAKVVDPNGTTLWDWANQPPYAQTPTALVWAIVLNDSTETYTFPNTAPTSGVPAVTAGTWKVTIGSSQVTKADITVLTKSTMPPTGNKVDVDFWVVSNSYTAATLPSASGWSTVLSNLSTYWGHGGVTVGTVTYHDVSAPLKSEFASIDADTGGACDAQTSNGGSLHKLFHSVTPGTNTGINFFLVDNILSGGTPGILGIDGAIPGPGGVNATPVSGAIAMVDLTSPSTMGYILAHEGGHFFGLWHTTEGSTSPVGWDPIADTPACTSGNVSTCSCVADRGYLMYPYAGCTTTGTISPNEGVIMRVAPSIY